MEEEFEVNGVIYRSTGNGQAVVVGYAQPRQQAPQTQQQPRQGGIQVRPPTPPKEREAPSGYQWGPNGTLIPITGGPADPATKNDSKMPPETPESQEAARREAVTKLALSRRLRGRSRDDWYTGGGWQLLSGIPGTNAYDFAAQTSTLADAGGLQRVMEMSRANGGKNPLTPLSNTDFQALSRSLTNLDPAQQDAQFQEALAPIDALYTQMYKNAGGTDLEGDLRAMEGGTPSNSFQRPSMNDELVNTAAAPTRVKRLSADQAGQVIAAAKSGDVGQTMALLQQFTGYPPDRAAIAKAIADYRRNPKAGITLSYDDASAAEYERHGTYGKQEIDARERGDIGPATSFGRQLTNNFSLGLVEPLQATWDAAFGEGKGDTFGERWTDNLRHQRAATDADFQVNPISSWTGAVGGALALPTRAQGMGAAAREATIAGGGSLREAQNAARAAQAAQFGRESAVYGGVQGAASNLDNPVGALKQGGIGAVTGGVFGRGLGGSIGAIRPEARALMNEVQRPPLGERIGQRIGARLAGAQAPTFESPIRVSIGQMMGGNIGKIEDVIASTPLLGGATNRVQQRAVQDLNRAAVNRALRPIGETLPREIALGTDAVDHATQRIGQVYDSELPNIAGAMPRNFTQRLGAIARRVNNRVAGTDGERNVQAAVTEALRPFNRNGNFTGRAWKDADETLGGLASSWAKSDDPYVRASAEAAEDIRAQLRRVVYNQNQQPATRLRAADRAYANLVRVQEASKLASNEGGVFSASQLNQAVKTLDQSIRKNSVGRGGALMQDLSAPGAMALRNKAGQGGSKDMNALLAMGAGGLHALSGAAGAAAPVLSPATLIAGGVLGANKVLYSRPGQAAARALLTGAGAQRGMRAAYQTPGALEQDAEDYFRPKTGPYNILIGGQ